MAISKEQITDFIKLMIKEKRRGIYHYIIEQYRSEFESMNMRVFIEFLNKELRLKHGVLKYGSFIKASKKWRAQKEKMTTKIKSKIKNQKKMEQLKNVLVLQSKGGVGKSYLSQLLTLYAQSKGQPANFIDTDNASGTLTKWFSRFENRKGDLVKHKAMNLLGRDNKIDRTMFDELMMDLENHRPCIVDFGAASSEQLMFWLAENDFLDYLKQLDVVFLIVMGGGNTLPECLHFLSQVSASESIKQSGMVKIVANEFMGDVKAGDTTKSVKDYLQAHIQIKPIHVDNNSSLSVKWKTMLSEGFMLKDLEDKEKMPVTLTGFSIRNYLNSIFAQFDKYLCSND